MKTVAIIPARGGSVSIPNKNIRDFAGKPLIAWSIELARAARGVDRVIVSTDSAAIADVARRYGAEVPFLRPQGIAQSTTALEPVLAHAFRWLADEEGYHADALVLLLPTSPLRQREHIEAAIDLFRASGADCVLTVHESPAHYTPYWTIVRDDAGRVTYFGGTELNQGYDRRQDFPAQCYAKNDLVFVIRPGNLLADRPSLYGKKAEILITDRKFDGDLNTLDDWDITLQMFRNLNGLTVATG